MNEWWTTTNEAEIPSPSVLLHQERVEENLRRMIQLVGSPDRLWPHVKTHKLGQLTQRQVALGITKFKCATIAEAEMCARAGASQILLAQQPVGPHPKRLAALAAAFPTIQFGATVDDLNASRVIAKAGEGLSRPLALFVDLDIGQHRTGLPPDDERATELYAALARMPGIQLGGLHAYDGHLHQSDAATRRAACTEAMLPVRALAARLRSAGYPLPRIVAGGTPTFPFHAASNDVECSPGTCVLWDAGYSKNLPDLNFLPAVTLLTRVVSKRANRLTLDLGHKAVASEMPHPRATFPLLPDAVAIMHNEEHLVLESASASHFEIGDALHAIPWHICPTMALHAEAYVVSDHRVQERWPIAARARQLTF